MLKPFKKATYSIVLVSAQLSEDYCLMVNGNIEGPLSIEQIKKMDF